jgi:hypothetical protein
MEKGKQKDREKEKGSDTHCRCNHGTVNKPTKTGYRETAKPRNRNPFLSTPIFGRNSSAITNLFHPFQQIALWGWDVAKDIATYCREDKRTTRIHF